MSTFKQLVAVDVIDLDDAVEDAEKAQVKAAQIAENFTAVAADFVSFADFVRANPHLTKHMVNTEPDSYGNRFLVYVHDAETLAEFARAAVRAGRKVDKKLSGEGDRYFAVDVAFGWLTLHVYAVRDAVCERVVTGTREVVEEIPDPEALAAVPTTTVTRTEEIVEWRCGSLLGGGSSAS